MGREVCSFPTYFLQRDDPHRMDDFFDEVTENAWQAQEGRKGRAKSLIAESLSATAPLNRLLLMV